MFYVHNELRPMGKALAPTQSPRRNVGSEYSFRRKYVYKNDMSDLYLMIVLNFSAKLYFILEHFKVAISFFGQEAKVSLFRNNKQFTKDV